MVLPVKCYYTFHITLDFHILTSATKILLTIVLRNLDISSLENGVDQSGSLY